MGTLYKEPEVFKLDLLGEYKNDAVIELFLTRFDLSRNEAEEVFEETKKWIWLCTQIDERDNFKLSANRDLPIIAEMWQTFILFTGSYTMFCKKYFGFYVHYNPSNGLETIKPYNYLPFGNDSEDNSDAEAEQRFDAVFKQLGEETILKWFCIYPKKYDREYLKSVSRH